MRISHLLFASCLIVLIAGPFLPIPSASAQTVIPGHTSGTDPTGAQGIVPCGAVSAANPYAATECGLCDFGVLVQRIINYLLILSLPVSAALFAYAGILLFTAGDKTENRSKAKSIFVHVFIGLLITLSGYLVVQTVLNALVNHTVFGSSFSFSFTNCAEDPSGTGSRPRATSISQLFSQLGNGVVQTVSGGSAGGGTPGVAGGTGQSQSLTVIGPNGATQTVAFNATQSDASLALGFTSVQQQYGDQINTACQGSSIPNCGQAVTALIAAESSGNANTQCNSSGACGLMQLLQTNGGAACSSGDSACINNQLSKGVAQLNAAYANPVTKSSLPNVFAAYNGGISTVPGSSPSGQNPAMAPSVDCLGLYAWQCSTNPGGLTQTQGYVASICRSLSNQGKSC